MSTSRMETSQPRGTVNWSGQYTIGIPVVDAEHMKLIGLMNDLRTAMSQRRGRAILEQIFDGLAGYTEEHFVHEERLLKASGYPDFLQHKAEHDRLIKRMRALKAEFESGTATVSIDVLDFLQDWLMGHIMKVDKQYVPCLQSAGH